MDDNQDSRASDAAATRKRRSSILKSQRPARTPFSELEFNVATPTDTAKSRRVSFSRRTGVAEFVTNEATTTWKNFYEEHNKSLESSGNDSDVNAARQPVEHLGRRIFDQQFEVEAVDLIGTITPTHSVHINFTEQITPTDYTADGKLTAPNNKFDFSALTDQQTKLFGNDFTVTGLGELSGKINFDFSNMGRIGDKDDLDEINKDLKRVSTNAVEVQADLRRDRHNVSEYIEVDLNTTHGAKDDDCDMSITDTIHSPKVQDVSRSSVDRKVNLNKDWMTDKENIAVNPYVAPVETDNFVINDEPDQVLVFDGKRVTLQTEKPEQDFGQTSRPHTKTKTPVRKTIVLNTNDDLPNFIDDVKIKSDESRTSTSFRDQSVCVKAVHKVNITKRSTANSSTDNISITQSLPTNIITSSPEKLKSMIHKESGQGNISITQSLNEKSFTATSKQIDRRRTVVHENESANMSVTRALPTNIIINDKVDKHKTIMFDEDKGNISLTQGISSQFVIDHAIKERRKTIVFDDDEANISITQALPSQVLLDNRGQEKRKTVLFDDDSFNISITHALSSNIVLESCPEKRQTLLFEDNTGDISITQAAPSNLILTGKPEATERRRTILYEDDTGNISVTQAIPQNIILSKTLLKEDTQIFDAGNISLTEVLPTNIILKENRNDKRKTIVYDDDTGNVSITQAIPSQLIPGIANIEGVTTSNIQLLKPATDSSLITDNKCKTIVYDTEAADISITEAIPANIMIPNQEQDFFEDATCDIPSKQEVPANVFLLEGMTSNSHERAPIIKDTKESVQHEIIKNVSENQDNVKYVEKRRTVIIANENGDDEMSITEAVPKIQNLIQETNKMLDFDVDKGNLSLTKPIPDQLTELYTDIINKSLKKDTSLSVQTSFCKPNVKVAVYQSMTIDTSEQIDLNTEPAVCNSISTTPSKVEEVTNVIESSMSSKDYVGNVVESKLDVYDIKMDALDEAEGATENDINVIKSEDIQSVSYDPKLKESKTSVLHTLLDMSEPIKLGVTDTYAETDNKSLSVVTEPEPEKDSSMIYFTIAEDEGIQTDKLETDASETDKDAESTENESDNFRLIRDSPMSIVSKEQSQNFGNTLAELVDKRNEIPEEKLSEVSSREDRYDEKIRPKSLKEANDTAELLDLISDFTDNNRSTSREVIPLVDARHVPVENKAEMHEPRRLSFATKRQSIIISREDLLNNISMAQAVLQKSRVEFEDCNLGEENQDSYVEEVTNSRRRSDRLSNEVVKTLHFDDESMSENSLKSDGSKIWPLRKVVTGESSPSVDKANVIPSYLKDVSDDIKQLMFDLVKPRSDAIPFENQEERLKRTMSTVSTQIQANLITSSQIDVDAELSSSRGSHENLENVPSDPSQDSVMEMANSREMPSQLELVPTRFHEPPCSGNTVPGNVLVFDHENPLNNIRLGPLDYVHAHDYKPIASTVALDNIKIKSDETLCGSEQSRCCQINMDSEINSTSSDIVRLGMKSTEVNTEPCVTQYRVAIREDKTLLPMCESILLDKAVHAQSKVGDTQVNTVIAMKQNKELLETSSSLTLIDDNLSKSITSSDSKTTSSNYYIARKERRTSLKSPVKSREGSAINSMDDDSYSALSKGKKRGHTPVTPSRRASVEVTPKPNSKVLKRSSSPNQNRILLRMSHESTKMRAERDTEEKDHVTNHSEDKAKNKKKIPNRNYGNTITIQQLITEYKIDADINKEILDVLKDTKYCESDSTEAPSQSDSTSDAVNEVSSFTSSKNLGDSEAPTSLKSQSTTDNTECSRIDWHPELSNLSSNKTVSYFDSGSNIVSKIDMLPFMGSYECERECSSADTWSFRLLHGRIRLTIRLAHRHDNATRTRVRADTPVTDITVDTIEYDKKNPVAILCIRFACETMRYMVSSRTETTYLARDVPLLLRRCAAVARVALRWGRAMHDAKLHLAYTLDTEGHLTLKVANIPLRSVWEVSMDLELVVEHPSQAPWPRAGNVSVHRVVSDVPVCDEDIHKVLKHTPNDWGHAPKTLWRMFRYLKNKQHDDDVILGV